MHPLSCPLIPMAGKNLKPYQGLKHETRKTQRLSIARRKKPKTLSGIETAISLEEFPYTKKAGKNLKPYQGLKPYGNFCSNIFS